ncbi:cbb3-type cytochrome oxidase assembly protein CcoS [Asticcacaulis sp. 201]|jgi:cbb3-type cytochrome oxidase maturation protein|nr:cbb3-type cytochrome oxidase assembly protein CcoS [Asticcacaulis sp. 201]MDV6331124.1 cbb3-type cytochrome oxidase assembly protein CcoS [Asticcacaulis sp. 201]
MAILLILVPLAFLLGLACLAAFLWALNTGQFDDLDDPAIRIFQPEDDE